MRQSIPREKLWGVLSEYGVDGRLLLALKSLYSCSNVCVRVGRFKSQPFTVGFGLQQGCVLPPLLFIVNISRSQNFPEGSQIQTNDFVGEPH